MHGIISTNLCTLLWYEHATSIVFIKVRIGMIIIHHMLVTPTILYYIHDIIVCITLWLYTSQYRPTSNLLH